MSIITATHCWQHAPETHARKTQHCRRRSTTVHMFTVHRLWLNTLHFRSTNAVVEAQGVCFRHVSVAVSPATCCCDNTIMRIWSICAFDQMRCASGKLCAFDQSPNHESNPNTNPNPNRNPIRVYRIVGNNHIVISHWAILQHCLHGIKWLYGAV